MSGYIGTIPTPQATQTRQTFTATASQTSFVTAGYTPGYIDVWMNGVKLVAGTDFTASNGSDVVLTSGAAAGDTVEILAYSTFEVVDQDFTGDFSVDTNTLYVNSTNNRVGVGTSNPAAILDVVGNMRVGANAGAGVFLEENENGGQVGLLNNSGSIRGLIDFLDADNDGEGELRFLNLSSSDGGLQIGIPQTNPNGIIRFDTNGAERMRVDVNGRVGVGTASPTTALDVSEVSRYTFNLSNAYTLQTSLNAAGSAFADDYKNAAQHIWQTSGTERMRVTDIGRVGIGDTNPFVSLVVNGGIAARGGPPGANGVNNNGYAFIGNGGDLDGGMFSSADGQIEFYTNATERMRVEGNGRVGINVYGSGARLAVKRSGEGDWNNRSILVEDDTAGASQPGIGFHAAGNATAGILKFWGGSSTFELRNSNDTGFIPIGASAFNVSSDYRLKENVVPLEGATDRLLSLPVHRFNFIEDIMGHGEGVTVDGFLAHEVADVVPEAVAGTKDAVDADGNPVYQGIDQSKLVPLLTAALQEALNEIAALKDRVAALETV